MKTKSYEISTMSTHSKTCLSVCLHDTLSNWHQMTSHNVAFIDLIGMPVSPCVKSKLKGGLYLVS